MDKIRLSRLRSACHLISIDEDDPAWKAYGRKGGRGRPCVRWSVGVGQEGHRVGGPGHKTKVNRMDTGCCTDDPRSSGDTSQVLHRLAPFVLHM